ncbi:MAG: fumarylacetoacetate hydrolase family protein [Methanobrevibacter sp.]|jgi:2-keto-4-pentenoate hydratase/2-oxohepta-3-ene-1,7-dioic acid hydratase in catechol pathway|nr:fumarylacetoacetate hydrolase family protein [Methanobrevibacter sp.]
MKIIRFQKTNNENNENKRNNENNENNRNNESNENSKKSKNSENKKKFFGILGKTENKVHKLNVETFEEIFTKSEIELLGLSSETYKVKDIKVLPPSEPSKIVCVGLNYIEHGKELNMEIPNEPKIFIKPSTSIIGHCDYIIYPKSSNQVDYEGELAIVISKLCKNVKKEDAKGYIGGYTILNDVTARDIQKKEIQWTRAKGFDTFAPTGPWINTDMDPLNQEIELKVNGNIKQKSNTNNMIFSPFELVEFISNTMTLNPGDIISTGTPSGVGSLNVGDTVEISIKDIGILKNTVGH